MIAVAVSILAGIYLLIPSLIFDKVVSYFVPAKKFERSRTDEFLYGLLVAFIPIFLVKLISHYSFPFGHFPFQLSPDEYLLKWDDYHRIVLALSSDSFFKDHAKDVWIFVARAEHHQERFLFWMYTLLGFQIAAWILFLRNVGRLMRFPAFGKAQTFLLDESRSGTYC